MAYGYRRKYRRRYRRPYRRYRRRYTRAQKLCGDKKAAGRSAWNWKTAGVTALKLANSIATVINTEKKYVDDTLSSDNVTSTKSINLFNALAKGDNHYNRDGDSILMQTLQVKGMIIQNSGATNTTFKVWYLLDKEAKGSLPNATDIWDSNGMSNYGIFDLRNRDYTDRFVILKERTYTMSDAKSTTMHINEFIKLGVHTKYLKGQSTGTISDLADNALYIVMATNEATNGAAIRLATRLTYTDN